MIMGNNNFNNGNIFNNIPETKIKTEGVSNKLNTQSYRSVEEIKTTRERMKNNMIYNNSMNSNSVSSNNTSNNFNKPVNHMDAVRNLRGINRGE